MLPQTQQRKKKNSSKINLLISLFFHGALAFVVLYFAAQTQTGKDLLKKIGVEMVKKEKPPEKPKEPEKPKDEPPKEAPKIVTAPKIEAPRITAPAPTGSAPAAAPAAIGVESFFAGKETVTVSDPNQLYKGTLEYAFKSRWNRPNDMEDRDFVAEVEIAVDRSGQITDSAWIKGSGNSKWDDSVKQAIAQTKRMSKAPPPNFPGRVTVRFDVTEDATILP